MLSLKAKIRKERKKRALKKLREKGLIPAILYGSKIKNICLTLDLKEFEKVYKKAGETEMIKLEVDDGKEYLVLIKEVALHPLTDKPLHVDFYHPELKEEIEVVLPLVFEGEAPAVKELGGTLVKKLSEIEVRGLLQKLPKEIKVDISSLCTFDDRILVGDLKLPEGVKVLRDSKEILAFVAPPEKVEEELEKPPKEEIQEVEVIKEKKKESEGA